MHTRFKADTSGQYQNFKKSADDYPRQLSDNEQLGFWQKPFDWGPGHPSYFNNMHQLLNGVKAMKLAPRSTIVEVGSGAGWATEILAALDYQVICLEPAGIMLEIAKKRVSDYLKLHRMTELASNVSYHCETLEEAEFIKNGVADAVLFFESFHHVIDENKALAQAKRVLKPGGMLCILGDSNWIPGNIEQEAFWTEEMDRFGTLESPFTHEYLEKVLQEHGFFDITRHHAVNGLIPVTVESRPVVEFVGDLHANYVNLFTAKREVGGEPRLSLSVERRDFERTDRGSRSQGGLGQESLSGWRLLWSKLTGKLSGRDQER